MAVHAGRLAAVDRNGHAAREGDLGQRQRRVVVAGDAVDHRAELGGLVHLAGRASVLTEEVVEAVAAVALRAARRDLAVVVPVPERFRRPIRVAGSDPLVVEGDVLGRIEVDQHEVGAGLAGVQAFGGDGRLALADARDQSVRIHHRDGIVGTRPGVTRIRAIHGRRSELRLPADGYLGLALDGDCGGVASAAVSTAARNQRQRNKENEEEFGCPHVGMPSVRGGISAPDADPSRRSAVAKFSTLTQ